MMWWLDRKVSGRTRQVAGGFGVRGTQWVEPALLQQIPGARVWCGVECFRFDRISSQICGIVADAASFQMNQMHCMFTGLWNMHSTA